MSEHLLYKNAAGTDVEAGAGAPLPATLYGTASTAGDTSIKATSNNQLAVAPLITTAASDALTNGYLAAAQNGTTAAQAVVGMGFNGATYDRLRTNVEGTALASAARTTTTSSADIVNYNGSGVTVYINATAASATPSVVFTIERKDPISGTYTTILASAAVTGISHTVLVVYPGATVAANLSASAPLPRTWRVTATHGDADSITYSVGYALNL